MEQIIKALRSKGITAKAAAEMIGCSRQAFYDKLNSKTPIKLWEAMRIAKAAGITTEELAEMLGAK